MQYKPRKILITQSVNFSAGKWIGEFDWSANGETLESNDFMTAYGATKILDLSQFTEADDKTELTCSARGGGQHKTIELRLRGITPLGYHLPHELF